MQNISPKLFYFLWADKNKKVLRKSKKIVACFHGIICISGFSSVCFRKCFAKSRNSKQKCGQLDEKQAKNNFRFSQNFFIFKQPQKIKKFCENREYFKKMRFLGI